jgi:hypothetical protein
MTTDTQTPATPDTPGTRFNSPAQLEYERMLAVKARPRIQASEVRVVDIDMPNRLDGRVHGEVGYRLDPSADHLEPDGSVSVRDAGRCVQVMCGA